MIRLGLHKPDEAGRVLPLANDARRAVGELDILRIRPTQTTGYRSSIPGASGLGMKLADQPDHPLAHHAVVNQANPLGRLTTSGTTVCGNTTSDRNGSKGIRQAEAPGRPPVPTAPGAGPARRPCGPVLRLSDQPIRPMASSASSSRFS